MRLTPKENNVCLTVALINSVPKSVQMNSGCDNDLLNISLNASATTFPCLLGIPLTKAYLEKASITHNK